MTKHLAAVLFALLLAGPAEAATKLKRGIYASNQAGCAALNRQDPDGRLDLDGIITEVRDTDASFLVIDMKTVGSIDFECTIGKARQKGRDTEWPLACEGESSGGKVSAMRSRRAGVVTFSGGLEGWGKTYFCH